ncbi:substrate-binding domain-containing protein [Amycolatopsis sp. NPDC003861]
MVVYSLVVDRAAGVDRLTTQQVEDIFSGRVRNWDQLRPGPSVPIGIVRRGQESGTRKTFERKVLGGAEDRLTSDSCRKPRTRPGRGDHPLRARHDRRGAHRGRRRAARDRVRRRPGGESVLKRFLDYLAGPTARAELQDAGYTPCVTKDSLLDPLCTRPDI